MPCSFTLRMTTRSCCSRVAYCDPVWRLTAVYLLLYVRCEFRTEHFAWRPEIHEVRDTP
jgi:hypothetical protein